LLQVSRSPILFPCFVRSLEQKIGSFSVRESDQNTETKLSEYLFCIWCSIRRSKQNTAAKTNNRFCFRVLYKGRVTLSPERESAKPTNADFLLGVSFGVALSGHTRRFIRPSEIAASKKCFSAALFSSFLFTYG
jgi:hypothetical protein